MSRRNVYSDESGSRENLRRDEPVQFTMNQSLHEKKVFLQQRFRHYWMPIRNWIMLNRRVIFFSLIVFIPLYLMLFPFSKVTPNVAPTETASKVGDYFYGKGKEILDKTRDYVNEKKEDFKDTIGKTTDKSKRYLNQKVGDAKDTWEYAKDKTKDTWENAKDKTKDTWQGAKDTVQEKMKDVGTTAKKILKKSGIPEKVQDARDYINEKTGLEDKLEDAKDYVQDKFYDVKDTVQETMKDVGTTAKKILKKSGIPEKVQDARDYINEKTGLEDKLEDAKDYINEKTGLGDKLEDAKEYVSEKIKETKNYFGGEDEDSEFTEGDVDDHVIETLDQPVPPIV